MALAYIAAVGNDADGGLHLADGGGDNGDRILRHLLEEVIGLCDIEVVEAECGAACDFIGDRRLQKTDGRAHACALGHNDAPDTRLFGETAGMKRSATAKGNHGHGCDVAAAFDGVNTGGIGHVLLHNFSNAGGGPEAVKPKGLADVRHKSAGRGFRVEGNLAACEMCGINLAETNVSVGHGGLCAAPAIGRGAGR